ncbi:D-2-hydroxyacid dehydrogenase family protein [Chryseobacterium gwangjuense]|jgi:Phosphoglycerate dehydrogenase and related dehydrogenases|uniref:D-2-hydroxyacid dehydrogenase family protein n=1 Tax=Chryseobacterium gwangjuense TaxID=1069980 RepID=UPI001E62B71A|nr:D-2-hydroxyacid dehydrogenase family protein [Chryseobacterium gwangjuense]MCE3076239.1 D-2-hydroxyacid dehydrogenase family protein [Chryseobacterium gwangjuense]
MKITILDDYQHAIEKLDCFKLLKDQNVEILHNTEKNVKVLAEKLKDSDIIVLTRERTTINEELISLLPNLKLISQTGKISNHLNLSDCTKYKVAVAEGIGSPIAPAELAWTLLLNTVRQIPNAIEGMKNGKWQTNIGSTIHGKTIGIWGYGKIGQRIAQYAKVFGAKVIVWGSELSQEKAIEHGFEKANSKENFFKNADIVTLHLRLNESTFGIVKESDLLQMKDNSILINTARAELIEKGKLLKSLKAGKPSYAGVDVYEQEPIYDKNYELLKFPNVICTPHLGYVEKNSYELYFGNAFENVLDFINGKLTNIANPEVLESL